jgi:hypothetical protein
MSTRFIGGSKPGIRWLFENLNPSGRDLEKLDSPMYLFPKLQKSPS